MNPLFLKYLKPLTITALLSFAAIALMQLLFFKQPDLIRSFWIIPAFYFLIYAAFHFGTLRYADNGQGFIRYYMAATVIKLFILLGVLVLISISNTAIARPFIINFLLTYMLFMIFEVYYLRKNYGTSRK